MKISKVEPQKKNRNRCSIFIDGEYRFGLSKDLVLKYDVKEGDEIDEDLIRNVLQEAEKEKIKQRAYKILHYRDRSVQELKNRLLKIGFDQDLVNDVLKDFIEDKILDDERFAKAFIRDYTYLKLKGNRFIIRELKKIGLSQETVDAMLKERNEKELIKNLIERKLKHLNRKDPKERGKIIRSLLSRGFTPDLVYDFLNADVEDQT